MALLAIFLDFALSGLAALGAVTLAGYLHADAKTRTVAFCTFWVVGMALLFLRRKLAGPLDKIATKKDAVEPTRANL